MKNRLIIAALAFGALTGCTKESSSVEASGDSAVQFTSATIATRTTEIEDNGSMVDAWESGDLIGITTSGIVSTEYLNRQYSATTEVSSISSAFDPTDSDNAIFYPNSQDQNITFYGYYPYSADFDEYVVMDISGQNGDLGSVDFMTANATWNYGVDDIETSIALAFEHKLSKVVFNLTFNDEAQIKESGNTISATISNVVKSKAYSTISGSEYEDNEADELTSLEVNASIEDLAGEDDATATITAILHPSTIESMVTVTLNDVDYIFEIEKSLESGKLYTYNVVMGREEALVDGQSTISEWAGGTPTDTDLEAGSDDYQPQLFWDGLVAETFNGVEYDIYKNGATYEITDGSELALLSQLVANGYTMYETTFIMTGNFTLSDREWTPILYTTTSYFQGTFDGGGYTISGLNVNHDGVQAGLFANIGSSGTIKNLTVKGSVTSSLNNVGAIVGYNYYGRVENCYSEATVTTTGTPTNIGGIVGLNYGTVTCCSNSGDVTGYSLVGGVVGYDNKGTVENCYNIGDISGNGSTNIGGVVGKIYYSEVTACYNIGDVYGSANYVGGITGYNDQGSMLNCCNIGEVEGDSNYVGGITGYNTSGTLLNCYNRGNVVASGCIGGIVGHNTKTGYVTSVYNTGKVSGDTYTAGVIGRNLGTLTYGFSYYNEDEGTDTIYEYNDDDTGKITSSEVFSDPSADIEDDSNVSHSLIDWLHMGSDDSSWESDTDGDNDGFPILTSINY